MSIKEELQKLKEDDLRKKIVIPYLKVCYPIVQDYHGTVEKGKDIIYITKDETWNRYIVGAVIIKNNGDIKMSGVTNMRKLHSQLMQTLTEQIPFPLDLSQKRHVEQIKVLTSYDINKQAMDFIYVNIYSPMHIVDFINGNMLEEIIQYFIKDKNNECKTNYEFDCKTFKSFCKNIPHLPKIKEEMKKIDIEGEGRNINESAQI
jgi:hypothetical protein